MKLTSSFSVAIFRQLKYLGRKYQVIFVVVVIFLRMGTNTWNELTNRSIDMIFKVILKWIDTRKLLIMRFTVSSFRFVSYLFLICTNPLFIVLFVHSCWCMVYSHYISAHPPHIPAANAVAYISNSLRFHSMSLITIKCF